MASAVLPDAVGPVTTHSGASLPSSDEIWVLNVCEVTGYVLPRRGLARYVVRLTFR